MATNRSARDNIVSGDGVHLVIIVFLTLAAIFRSDGLKGNRLRASYKNPANAVSGLTLSAAQFPAFSFGCGVCLGGDPAYRPRLPFP